MPSKPVAQIVGSIVDELGPLSSEERRRVVQAAMTLLGEEAIKPSAQENDDEVAIGAEKLHARVKAWMKQNELSADQLQQVFHIEDGKVEVIASVPGPSKKEQTRNAYILVGVASFLLSGEQKFEDAVARALCQRFGFYDSTNHSKYTKGWTEFAGSAQSSWTITQPGLKVGAGLIKAIAGQS